MHHFIYSCIILCKEVLHCENIMNIDIIMWFLVRIILLTWNIKIFIRQTNISVTNRCNTVFIQKHEIHVYIIWSKTAFQGTIKYNFETCRKCFVVEWVTWQRNSSKGEVGRWSCCFPEQYWYYIGTSREYDKYTWWHEIAS